MLNANETFADNIDYDDIKTFIKENTTPGHGKTISVPGRPDDKLAAFENDLFHILAEQHMRIGLFVKSKISEIQRRLGEFCHLNANLFHFVARFRLAGFDRHLPKYPPTLDTELRSTLAPGNASRSGYFALTILPFADDEEVVADFHAGDSKKRLKQLASRRIESADGRIAVGRLERYGKLENDVIRIGEEIKSLARFIATQRTAFRKLLKKYKKWTGSTVLEGRFRDEVLEDPKSFTKLDLGFMLDDYSATRQSIRTLYDNYMARSMGAPRMSASTGPERAPAASVSCFVP